MHRVRSCKRHPWFINLSEIILSNFSSALLPARDECSCVGVHCNMGKQMLCWRGRFQSVAVTQQAVFLGFPSGLHTSAGFTVPLLLCPEAASGNSMSLPVKKQSNKGVWESQDGFPITLKEYTGFCALTGSVRHWFYWNKNWCYEEGKTFMFCVKSVQ